jgi:hypothetical protein
MCVWMERGGGGEENDFEFKIFHLIKLKFFFIKKNNNNKVSSDRIIPIVSIYDRNKIYFCVRTPSCYTFMCVNYQKDAVISTGVGKHIFKYEYLCIGSI